MSLITSSSLDNMVYTTNWLELCNTIKLYKTHSEHGLKDLELLSIDTWDNKSELKDLLLLISMYLKGDERVGDTLRRIKEGPE